MGYDIGPRIGIQGEKEFNNQIKAINNSIKEYGSEMNALTNKFSENANSQEALTAKSKVLQKQYDAQKQKSDLLEKQYKKEIDKLKELADSYQKAKNENGEMSAEAAKAETAYNKQAESVSKLKVAMNETEGYMGKLENAIHANSTALSEIADGTRDAVTGLSNVGDAAAGTGDKLDDISKKVQGGNLIQAAENFSGVGDKIIDMGGKAVQSFQSIEDAVIKVNARFGETGDAAKTNEKLIRDVYESGVGDSLDSVANAVILVKDNLKDLNETDMNKVVSQGLILEDTYGIDMAESIRGVNSLMQHFGIDASDAMNLLVAGTQGGLDKTNELGDNLAEYSGKFAEAGYSAQEYFQLLQNGLDNGAYNLDKVNDAINEVTTRIADGTIADSMSKINEKTGELEASSVGWGNNVEDVFRQWQQGGATQKQVVDAIVADIQNTESQQDKLNKAALAFGTMAEDGSMKFISSLTSVGDVYTDVSGKADELQENTTTSSQQIEAAIRKIQDALAPMGGAIADIAVSLAPLVETVAGAVGKFSELPQPMQTVILAISGILVGLSKIAPVLASLKAIGIGSALATVGSTITGTVIPAIGGALVAAAPVVAVIAGIAAAVVGVIAVIKNWSSIMDWMKEHIGKAIDAVKGFFGSMADKIGEVKDKVVSKVTELKDKAVEKFNNLKTSASESFQKLRDSASEKFEGVKRIVAEKTEGIRSITKEKLDNVKRAYDEAGGGIKGIAAASMQAVKESFSSKLELINSLTGNKMEAVRNKFSDKIQSAKEKVNSGIESIKGIFNRLNLRLPSIEIPRIKLPHFSISGSFSINPPSVPHLSVDWYKKGGILSGAQIFGRMGDRLLGGGEAGKEAVLPLNTFYDRLEEIMYKALNTEKPDYSDVSGREYATNVNVYVGNKKFDSYIVKTAEKGISRGRRGGQKARGQ
jgi:phage-related minor tail protein